MTPTEIKERAEKAWWRSLEAGQSGEPFFPWTIPLPRVSSKGDDYETITRQSEALLAGSKERTGHGYCVVTESRNLRLWGRNEVPVRLVSEKAGDLDAFVGRPCQRAAYKNLCAKITARLPVLETWATRHASQILAHQGRWGDLLTVCEFFVATPKPSVYLREIPVPVHTKFIEEHRSILGRLLDQLLPAGELGAGASRRVSVCACPRAWCGCAF